MATADTQAGGRVGRPVPEPGGRPTRIWCSPPPTPPPSTAWTWCSWPCPTAPRRTWCRSCASGSARSSTWPPTSGCATPALYPQWYGEEHRCPELLARGGLGIPELFPDELPGATLVAAAGCYLTAAALALAPLVRAGVIEPTGDRGRRGQRGVGGRAVAQAAHPLQHGGRGLHRLRAAHPPPHARDRAGGRPGPRSSSRPTWRR